MKKGVFFTLGLTFFAFIVLSLSFIFANNSIRYDERFVELVSINRVYDLGYSVQSSIAEMFQLESGLTYTVNSAEAIFQLTYPLNFTKLNNSFNELNDFVKANDNKSVSIEPMPRNLSLTIIPHGIIFWQNITQNASYYTKGNGEEENNPISYSFLMDLPDINITSCNSSYSSGTFKFYVSAVGSNGTACNVTLSVNPQQTSSIGVTAGTSAIVARVSNYDASLNVGKAKIALTTRVGYNAITEEEDDEEEENVYGQREKIELNQKVNVTIKGLIVRSFSNVRLV